MSDSPTTKSFWKKPEGITGLLLLAGLGVGFYYLLPFIISLLANAITAIALGVVLLALIYAILDGGIRTGVWYLFKMGCRAFTNMIVRIDPISIMKVYIADLTSKRNDMSEQISKLDAEQIKLKKTISDANDEMEQALANSRAAQNSSKPNKQGLITGFTRQYGRQKDLIAKLTPLSQKMEIIKTVLNKMYENAGIAIEDMESEVQVREIEYQTVKRGYNAMKSAMSIFKGDPDKKAMYDQATELVESNISFKAAEMNRFMRESQSVIDKIDIENESYSEEGLQMLEQMGNRNLQILLAPVGEKMQLQPASQTVTASGSQEFDTFFTNNKPQ